VTLTFDHLTLNSCRTWRVTWSTLPPNLKTRRLLVYELRVITFPPWLTLKMRTRPLRMRRITWPVSREWKTITYLESPTPICLLTIQLFADTTTIKGRLLWRPLMLKPFSGEKNSKSRRNGADNWRFWKKIGAETLHFGFATPKGTSLRGTASFDVFCVKIGARVSAVAFLKNQKNSRITLSRGARNHACAEPKPLNRFG